LSGIKRLLQVELATRTAQTKKRRWMFAERMSSLFIQLAFSKSVVLGGVRTKRAGLTTAKERQGIRQGQNNKVKMERRGEN
jgi:hypothetical protein